LTLAEVLFASLAGVTHVATGVKCRPGVEKIKAGLRQWLEPLEALCPIVNWLRLKVLGPEKRTIIMWRDVPSLIMGFVGGMALLGFCGAVCGLTWPLYQKTLLSDPLGVISRAGFILTACLAIFAFGYYFTVRFLTDLSLLLLRSWPQLRIRTT
jgi:hypothetical protein